jgi:transposase
LIEKRRRYTREFKLEAVRLAEESERPMAEVARDLGIHPNNLYKWRQQLAVDGEEAYSGHGQVKKSDEEVRHLRRELARVRQERDVLKKALLFFTKEQR